MIFSSAPLSIVPTQRLGPRLTLLIKLFRRPAWGKPLSLLPSIRAQRATKFCGIPFYELLSGERKALVIPKP